MTDSYRLLAPLDIGQLRARLSPPATVTRLAPPPRSHSSGRPTGRMVTVERPSVSGTEGALTVAPTEKGPLPAVSAPAPILTPQILTARTV